jgi:hypothetical protein
MKDNRDINGKELYYNRIEGLRNNNVITPTSLQQVEEIKKCQNSFEYFCRNYFTIVTLDKGECLFEPYDYQIEFADLIEENRFVVGMMARQLGKGTIVTAILTWYMLFKKDYSVTYLAHDHKTAIEMLKRIKLAYSLLPMWLQVGVTKWNEKSIEFENGCRLDAAACTETAARGSSRNMIVLDEFAFVRSTISSEFLSSVIPALSSGRNTKLVIFSTPNGFNAFSKIFIDAQNGKNDFKWIKKDWRAIPTRDDKWAKTQRDIMGDEKFNQEHELEILGSSATLLDAESLNKLNKITPVYENSELSVYEHPQEKHRYIIGVDVARGLGKDYTVCQVVDYTEYPYKQVAIFRCNKTSYLFMPKIISDLGVHYNNAKVIVEGNDLGQSVSDSLFYGTDEMSEYENLLGTGKDPHSGQIILNGVKDFRTCLITTNRTKLLGCRKLRELIKYDKLKIYDKSTIEEFYTFVETNSGYAAEDPNHDDTIMGLALIAWCFSQKQFIDEIESDVYGDIAVENDVCLAFKDANTF